MENSQKTARQLSPALILLGVAAAIAVLAVLLPERDGPDRSEKDGRPAVAASVYPAYDVVRGVAGGLIDVRLVLPIDASPHTFEPTPSQIVSLSGVRTVFAIGQGLDNWAERLTEAVGAETVTLDRGIAVHRHDDPEHEDKDDYNEEGHEHEDGDEHHEDDEGGHHHGEFDPHYWLDPANIVIMAENARRELSERWPELADGFRENMTGYLAEIDRADREAREILAPVTNRQMIVMHDAWRYFAEAYGLEVAGVFEPSAGREPTPQYLAGLTAAARKSGVRTVYGEPQLSNDTLRPFIEDNGLRLAELDPLGGSPRRETLAELITYNAQTIADNQ